MHPAHPVVALVLLAACSSGPAAVTPSPGADAPTAPVAADTLDLPPADRTALAEHLEAGEVTAALAYDRAFRTAETGDDLKSALDQAIGLLEVDEAPPEWEALERFTNADFGLPGLDPTCVAECTEVAFDLDIETWQRAARRVGDESAVGYFDMLHTLYDFPGREEFEAETGESYPVAVGVYGGQFVNWPVYLTQMTDASGVSNVGSGVHADLLDAFVPLTGLEGAFEDEIRALQEEVALDLVESVCIGPSADDAIAEVVRVNDSMTMPAIAQSTYDARVAALENPDASGIQTGCEAPGSACDCW